MELLPTLCFLGHQSAGPRLRLVRLPEESVEPSPVPLDGATGALDRGFARDGWLAFTPNEEVWGVPAALDGPAFRVGRWWDCVPSPNPRTVWLANPVDPDPNAGVDRHAPTVLVEYDGVLRQEIDRRELARSLRLEATAPDGWILRADGPRDADVLLLWPWHDDRGTPVGSGWEVLASHGPLLAVGHRDGRLTFIDTTTATEIAIPKPLAGPWHDFGSFSPDGNVFAISIEAQRQGIRGAWRLGRQRLYEPISTHLALIDTATGAVTLAEGRFDNFATSPVWSQDSAWLIFDAPFDTSLFLCDVRSATPTLVRVIRRPERPTPLIDVSPAVQ